MSGGVCYPPRKVNGLNGKKVGDVVDHGNERGIIRSVFYESEWKARVEFSANRCVSLSLSDLRVVPYDELPKVGDWVTPKGDEGKRDWIAGQVVSINISHPSPYRVRDLNGSEGSWFIGMVKVDPPEEPVEEPVEGLSGLHLEVLDAEIARVRERLERLEKIRAGVAE